MYNMKINGKLLQFIHSTIHLYQCFSQSSGENEQYAVVFPSSIRVLFLEIFYQKYKFKNETRSVLVCSVHKIETSLLIP